MSNSMWLYWLTRLDSVRTVAGVFTFFTSIILTAWIICAIVKWAYSSGEKTRGFRENEYAEAMAESLRLFLFQARFLRRIALSVWLLSIGLQIFLPTQGELIFIVAGGKTMDYVQSDSSLVKIPGQTTKIISDYLQKTIEEMKKENK